MAITASDIKTLRERTGAGMGDCKKALEETGDLEKAVDWLRQKGIAKAAKKSGRVATEGLVHSYIHGSGRVGVLVEVNAETDFVSRNEQFQTLVNDIALHIAASAPLYLTKEEVPADVIARESAIYRQRALDEGKPEKIVDRIVESALKKFYEDSCLLEQKFIKDDSKTMAQVVTEAVSTIGENIKIRRFARFELGEGLEKTTDDFAAEVAAVSGVKS